MSIWRPSAEGGSGESERSKSSGDGFVGPPESLKGSDAPGNKVLSPESKNDNNRSVESPSVQFQRQWQEYSQELQLYVDRLRFDQKIKRGELPSWSDITKAPEIPGRVKEFGEYSSMIAGSTIALASIEYGAITVISITGATGLTLLSAPIVLSLGIAGMAVLASGGTAGASISSVPRYLHPVSLVTTLAMQAAGGTTETANAAGKLSEGAFELTRLLGKPINEWDAKNVYDSYAIPLEMKSSAEEMGLKP